MNSTLQERMAAALAARPSIKQIDLARACEIKPPSVNDWLSGKSKRIDGVHLIKACDLLGVRPKWMALGVGPMRDKPTTDAEALELIAEILRSRTAVPAKETSHE